jgi:UDP-glucose 4-epimerase
MSRGLEYFDVNTLGTWNLAQCALQFNIERFIYSSTCAVYGEISGHTKVSESSLTAPTTDYGRSKLAAEWILKSLLEEKLTIFRYFNAIGQSTNELSDLSGESLFSAAKRAVVTGEIFKIFGNKFNTPDGTCLRDFIDCRDIARAHTLAISRTRSGAKLPTTINLGTGKSTSVLQVINEIRKWQDISWEYCGARSGDIAVSCADVNLAKQTLGFTAIHDVPSSVQSVFGTLVH